MSLVLVNDGPLFECDQFVNLGPCLSLGGFTKYTITAIVKPHSVKGVRTIFSKFNGGVAAESALWIEDGFAVSYRNVAPWTVKSPIPIPVGEWSTIVTTYDGSNLTIEVNGSGKISAPFTSQPDFPNVDTVLGCRFGQGQAKDFFEGHIKDVRFEVGAHQ